MGGVIPEKSSHCSPLQPTLTWQFQSGGNSLKVLPLQPTAAHSYMEISVMGGLIPEKSSHCSPLLHGNFSQGGRGGGGNSWKVLPLQPIAAHFYMAISVRGVIPQKSSHCSPTLTSFYPLWTNYPPGWSPRLKTGIGQTDHTQNSYWPDRLHPKIGIGQTERTLATIGQTEQTLDTIGQTDQTLSRPLGRPNRP